LEYIYEVSSNQAHKWNNFTRKQKLELVKKADKERTCENICRKELYTSKLKRRKDYVIGKYVFWHIQISREQI